MEQASPLTASIEDILAGVDQNESARICIAFDKLCAERSTTNATVLWSMAQIYARILATADMADVPQALDDFKNMTMLAYPVAVKAMEMAQRKAEGRRAFDG